MKVKGWLLIVSACLTFFFGGMIVSNFLFATGTPSPVKSDKSILSFNIPQVILPSNWASRAKLPGNSFESAWNLDTGIKTQGTFSVDNVVDFYVFNLKSASQVIVDVTDVPKSLYWVLYDYKLKEVASTYRKGASGGSTTVTLQNQGKYYIKVWADYHEITNYPYTIRLSVLPYFD